MQENENYGSHAEFLRFFRQSSEEALQRSRKLQEKMKYNYREITRKCCPIDVCRTEIA